MRATLAISFGLAAALGGAVLAARSAEPVDAGLRVAVPLAASAMPDPETIAGFPVGRVAPAARQWPTTPYNGRFVFTRIRFDDGRADLGRFGGRGREPWWHHDHPSAEYNFAKILETVSFVVPTPDHSNILTLEDDAIFQYPIIYMVEPGHWNVNEREIVKLREYLLKGGFMIVDDLDDRQMYWLAEIFRRVLPELPFVPLAPTDPVFDSFFNIDPRILTFQGAAYRGDQIDFWGIYQDNDPQRRLLVIAGNRGDLGEFWEYSDVGFFPIDITNEAYKVGVNYIVYAMTH